MRVAVVGTGTMGAGMARAMHRAGLDVVAWNRTRSRAEPLAAAGIAVADGLGDAVTEADVVITVLFDADSVFAVSDELTAALGPDAVWLQSATIGVDATRRLAGLVGEKTALLDAPVLGTKKPAEDGTLTALVSGPPDLIERARPVLDAVGSKTVVAGARLGEASALKLACNAWIATITAGTAQSVTLARALGLDPHLFLQAIDGSAVDTPYAQLKGSAMIAGDFTPSFEVDGVVKDLALITDAAANAGVDERMLRCVQALFAQAADAGHGADDMAAVATAFR